jgi:hypothetical protein
VYTRVAVGGRAVWGREGDEDVELLSESPLDGDPVRIGTVPIADARSGCPPSSRPCSTRSA